ncbi:MAG: hypothetical protein CALGDGBN_02551 [Pseudomonadales bacterium]|nr:hypothetical protein [Pseudomonadales bacterium]
MPLTAVAVDATRTRYVWVVGEEGRGQRREVSTGEVRGARIAMAAGLAPGERVVTAGTGARREGMTVHPLAPR